MGVKITNNASGTLAAAITSGATTLTLTTGQGALFPTLGVGDYSWCTLVDTSNNVEIIKVTARSTDTLTMTRGQDGTTARAFAINDRLELRPTAALFAEFADPDVGGDLSGTASNAQIVANAVGTTEIANSAVTDAKIAGMSSSKLSGALPAIDGSALTGMPAGGKVLQVVQAELTGLVNFASGQVFLDTGLSATITPSSTSSKILVMANMTAGSSHSNNFGIGYRILRGSTTVAEADANTGRMQGHSIGTAGSTLHDVQTAPLQYLDSPSTTSATTYKIQGGARDRAAWTLNRPASDGDATTWARLYGISTIILMEIGA